MPPASRDRLIDLMNSFADTYNQFTAKMQRGMFDSKLAMELSRRWKLLEDSGLWPK